MVNQTTIAVPQKIFDYFGIGAFVEDGVLTLDGQDLILTIPAASIRNPSEIDLEDLERDPSRKRVFPIDEQLLYVSLGERRVKDLRGSSIEEHSWVQEGSSRRVLTANECFYRGQNKEGVCLLGSTELGNVCTTCPTNEKYDFVIGNIVAHQRILREGEVRPFSDRKHFNLTGKVIGCLTDLFGGEGVVEVEMLDIGKKWDSTGPNFVYAEQEPQLLAHAKAFLENEVRTVRFRYLLNQKTPNVVELVYFANRRELDI